MAALSPKAGEKLQATTLETQKRLERCWKVDVNWTHYPEIISKVDTTCIHAVCMQKES